MKLNAGGLSSLVIGRENDIDSLKAYIEFSQHVVLTAPRRYGKTTLVNKVLDDLKDDYLVVKVDLFEATSIKELCDIYLNAIYRSIGIVNFLNSAKKSIFSLIDKFSLSYEHEGIKLGYEISRESDESKLIERTFNFSNKFAKLFDKNMIVFFDEFGDVEKFGQEFIKKLRTYMQLHSNVVYVFSGSQASVMNNIFLDKQNAFFNFATLMNIDMLQEDTTVEFLKDLSINKKTLDNKAIDKIIKSTKLHPFYLIKTLQESYIKSLFASSKDINISHIKDAIKKILVDNNAYFESIWQSINYKKYKGMIFKSYCKKDRDILKTLKVSPSYKSQLIKELKLQSLLSNTMEPTDPFLCLWLLDRN
jgi:AAA+ ATPase superfamily predicted ATPase